MSLFLKILKWSVISIAVAFAGVVVYRMFYLWDVKKTQEQVARIHATKLTLNDVMGKNLPPDPGLDANKTVQGIDANHNGIRDDVELAIFKEYPHSAKTRAVLLQYALALQMEVVQPMINAGTVTAVAEDGDRALSCIRDNTPRGDTSLNKFLETLHGKRDFVKKRQINTKQRDKYQLDFYEHLGSYNSPNEGCDIDISTLPN